MPDLNFKVEGVQAEKYSAVPTLVFKIRIDQSGDPSPIHTVALHCQIRLEPGRRKYNETEAQKLVELFGGREQWIQTMRSTLWTHASAMVPAFAASTAADLPVPCTFDFNVAMTKYFDALEEGDVPISLLFSGTVFYQNTSGNLQAAPISWDKEANYRLPSQAWREMMQHHYPNAAWMCINKESFDRLHQYKVERGHVSWERAIDELLDSTRQGVTG